MSWLYEAVAKHERENRSAEWLNEQPQCAWCFARGPIALRLYGMDLCADCAPKREKKVETIYMPKGWLRKRTLLHRSEYESMSQEDRELWIGRRKHLLMLGWSPNAMPPRLEV